MAFLGKSATRSAAVRGLRLGLLGAVMVVLAACSTLYRNHGYVPTDDDLATLEVGVDTRETVTEKVGTLTLKFLAGEFFQNNPSVLPEFVAHAVDLARASGARHLVDAYCGSGLFALSAAPHFESVSGVEVSAEAVRKAAENAALNRLLNCRFIAGSAESIFAGLPVKGPDTAVIVDPPRRGCDEAFLAQLDAFAPRRIVYVSCGSTPSRPAASST